MYDNGGTSSWSAIEFRGTGGATGNQISNNRITDTAGSGYAIKGTGGNVINTIVFGNIFSGTGSSSLNLSSTTIYNGQAMSANGKDIRYSQTSSTSAFTIQNANGVNLFNADTTNGEIQFGNYNGGTNAVNGKISFNNSTNANTVGLQSGATSTSYNLTLPTGLGSSGDCLVDTTGTGVLGFTSCGGGGGGGATRPR